ncbi:tRNA (adenosine(37)-N6)-threonylcarbamoyltransferase complex transferase subunit TsaD [Patescibacteria group bacterium]|nr:tRNA (adenosine(37)-N6)-threonylcarbamoyltransferase complex transferase subunit TsaD [Patescibacteria group bacterium]
MKILGIETSCDDTCAALLDIKRGKFNVLKSIVASQANLHKKYGGVVPEVAARKHVETIIPVISEAIRQQRSKVDVIAIASGPGLISSLHVGVETAKALSLVWDVPLIKVNHIEAHIYSVLLSVGVRHASHLPFKFPAIALIVSGGHTELILMRDHGKYSLLGRTRDDAAGEAFDKSAKMLGLPYPGGPQISQHAQHGDPRKYDIPKPMIHEPGYEFSFSGMKNAIRLLIENFGTDAPLGRLSPDLCASIEQAIIDVLTNKSIKTIEHYKPKTFILAGGVSANKKLRKTLKYALPKSTQFLAPDIKFCMDNASMVAVAAYFHAKNKEYIPYHKLTANANWELV